MSEISLKKLVPKQIKQPIKRALLRRQLNRAIKAIANLKENEIPSRDLLLELITGWDNAGYVANIDYLEQVARCSIQTTGNILECGSGVTTLLIGLLCSRQPIEVWSLEHSSDWQKRIAEVLETNGISNTRVCFSPLIEYGEFRWYDPPLENMPRQFSLVICDGPPGSTLGGRYGLLPVMNDRLTDESIILLDDAARAGEMELIRQWQAKYGFKATMHDRAGNCFAVVRRG